MGGMRYQPQGLTRLSPMAMPLAPQVVYVGNTNAINGDRLPRSQAWTREGFGAVVSLNDAVPIPLGATVASSWTLLMVIRRDSAQNTSPYFLGVSITGGYQYALAGSAQGAGGRTAWYDGVGFQDSGFTQPFGDTDTIGLTFDGTTNRYSWYKNGRAYNSTVGANNGGAGIWQFAAVGGESNTNTIPMLAIGALAASPSEMAVLTSAPWLIFDDQSDDDELLLAVGGAPSGYTLPAAKGSYTITGSAAGLRAARRLTASPGAYALTGNAATLRAARRLTAAPGSYAITGNAANLIKGTAQKSLQTAAGSYVITGRPAVLRAARRLVAAPGSYAITGFSIANPVGPVLNLSVRFDVLPRNYGLKTIHFSN